MPVVYVKIGATKAIRVSLDTMHPRLTNTALIAVAYPPSLLVISRAINVATTGPTASITAFRTVVKVIISFSKINLN